MGRDLTRRRFLQLAALAAPAAPSLLQRLARRARRPPAILSSSSARASPGLRAADILRKAGRPVVVLEARERAGGRVLTVRSPFDDGLHARGRADPHCRRASGGAASGEIVRPHAHAVRIVARVAGRGASRASRRPPRHGERVRPGGAARSLRRRPAGRSRGAGGDRRVVRAMADRTTSVTWPEYLRSRGATPEAITRMTVGGDASDLSALYVLRQFAMLRHSTQRYKIQGGMDLLPRAMASALGNIVRYNVPVVRVTRESSAGPGSGQSRGCGSASTIRRRSRREPDGQPRHLRDSVHDPARHRDPSAPVAERRSRRLRSCRTIPARGFSCSRAPASGGPPTLSGSARTDRATEVWDSTYDQVTSPRGILGASVGGARRPHGPRDDR